MAEVEHRVVRMEFDNAAFERRIKQTLRSLADLDKSLKLTGATKGLTDVSNAAKKVNLAPIVDSARGIGGAFVAASAVAVTALATITSAAIHAGASMVHSLSLEPLLQGFQEYELNIGSIQTILANTSRDGTSLQQVNDALDELNEYSDQTIYNFAQMTKNIGTFTAAGVSLDTAVSSIKGIANLAAISGSTSEQASTAMYQLSQAIAANKATLVDWNSVVNAGMGGEVFQRALFATGQALGTITDAPVGTTFDEWTAAGNSFRDSLQEGWITGEVLTTTLQGFTGELTAAQLESIGYTQEQIAEIQALGEMGVEAATKIRTVSALMTTVKETVTSGWAETFRTIFGDFEEATVLFTQIGEGIVGFVQRSNEARNELLEGWDQLGGRLVLIQAFQRGIQALISIVRPVREAFREIFPRLTSERLFEMTEAFSEFMAGLRPSLRTIANVKDIFRGLFSALEIGWTVFREGTSFVRDFIAELLGLGEGNILEFAASIGDVFTTINESLEGGQRIREFFDELRESIDDPVQLLQDLGDAIADFFSFDDDGVASDAAERLSDRFSGLGDVLQDLPQKLEPVADFFRRIGDILGQVGDLIGEAFDEVKNKLAEAFGPGEFNEVLDALNTGLLGGIAFLLARWLRGGINIDFGEGLFQNISSAFEELTGVLEALQTKIRSDALQKIAIAVALLAASMVALSLIDSGALTRALVAMSVGFTQLMGAFALLNALDSGFITGVSFTAIAAGMVLLAGAMVVMSVAVRILAGLGWEDLAKGLLAVTTMLGVMVATSHLIASNAGNLILAGIGMTAMAVGLTALSGAVAIFGNMEWDTLVRGFASVATGLLLLAGAARLMPENMVRRGVGLIFMATALNILARAVKEFAEMDWDEMVRGFVGMAGGLGILIAALHLMPPNIVAQASGVLILSGAMLVLGEALENFGEMSWTEIGKGLATLAGALLILVVALNAMSGSISGSFSLLIASAALAALAQVIVTLGDVPFGDVIKGIAGLALGIGVIAVAATLLAPVAPALLSFGAALLLVGGGFALFGVGVLQIAEAFRVLGEAGPEGTEAFIGAMKALGRALPDILTGLAVGIINFFEELIGSLPELVKAFGRVLGTLIEELAGMVPRFGELFVVMGETALEALRELFPDVVETGILFISTFLKAVEENIGDWTSIGLSIITQFLLAIGEGTDALVEAGAQIIVNLLLGIASRSGEIGAAASAVVYTFVLTLGSLAQAFIDAGTQVIVNILLGISQNMNRIAFAAGVLVITFINTIANLGTSILNAGTNAVINLVNGISQSAFRVATAVTNLITTFINTVFNAAGQIIESGANAIINFVTGLGRHGERIVQAGVNTVLGFLKGVASNAVALADGAAQILIDFLNALADVIENRSDDLRAAGARIAGAIIDGITGGLASQAGEVAGMLGDIADGVISNFQGVLGINSPSTVFAEIGRQIMQGLEVGLVDGEGSATDTAVEMVGRTTKAIEKSIRDSLAGMETAAEFRPTVVPVVDLSQVHRGASDISRLMGGTSIDAEFSASQARSIASTSTEVSDGNGSSGSGDVNFTQINNSPKALSTKDIYRSTRNQITMAKEELSVA